jgi:hypothetical protein
LQAAREAVIKTKLTNFDFFIFEITRVQDRY